MDESQQNEKFTQAKGWRYIQNVDKHLRYKHFKLFQTFPWISLFMV